MRAAVLGSPIAHSLSPALHRAAYRELGLDWSYDAIECDEAGLPAFVDSLDEAWAGLSLTMPLKRAVLPLLDEMSEIATSTGVANTVLRRDGRKRGDNTDVDGVVAALRDVGVDRVRSVSVLGAGATAVSALAAARELGARDARIVARSQERAQPAVEAADRIGLFADYDTWPGSDKAWRAELVVSTVPTGAAEAVGADHPWPGALLDVVYAPWPTPLAAAASAAGVVVASGLAMLLHQAARQVELMTGQPAPLAAMRAALPPP
ncbi:MAG: shikimate dehydrogenase [Actinomycetes bacterium]